MTKYAINLSDELNDTLPEGLPSQEDTMSVSSDDVGDDTNDVQIVDPKSGSSSGIDETCDDRPLGFLDNTFYVDYAALLKSENGIHIPFSWLGITWDLLLKKVNHKQMGVYVGYLTENVSSNFCLKLKVTFALVDTDKDNTHSVPPRDFSHIFRTSNEERYDHGFNEAFQLNDAEKRTFSSNGAGARIILEEEFAPTPNPPPKYDSKRETSMVGLENLGATCYLNALLQMLFHVNAFRKAVYKLPHDTEVYANSTTLALQSVFKNLQCTNSPVTTRDLTRAFGWTSQEAFLQQDVQEMMRVLLDKLEEKMKDTSVEGTIGSLFAGNICSYIRCVDVQYESKREEDFYDVQLDVKGCNDIYESLRKYTGKEMLDGENQYDAGPEFGKQDAEKGVIFTKFPPVLTVHLKRFDFDLQRMCFTKIHDNFTFPARLHLDAYLAPDAPPESRATPNIYLLHSVLVHAGDVGGGHYYAYIRPNGTVGMNYESFAAHARDVSEGSGGGENGNAGEGKEGQGKGEGGGGEGGESKSEGDGVDEKRRAEMKEMLDTKARNGQWLKFNDETVTKVKPYEAINYCFGRDKGQFFGVGSAYMLVYIRESDASMVMDKVTIRDIPISLCERLDALMLQRIEEARRISQEKAFKSYKFVTEENIRDFHAYKREADFISLDNMQIIKIMEGSTYMRLYLSLAEMLSVYPCDIRLWMLENAEKGCNLRVSKSICLEEFKECTIGHAKFYVEILPVTQHQEFILAFEELKVEERKWLDRLREELAKLPENYNPNGFPIDDGSESFDLAEGCGMMSANKPLDLLKLTDPGTAEHLRTLISVMDSDLLDAFKAVYQDCPHDNALLFFKAFDPDKHLPETADSFEDALKDLGPSDSTDSMEANNDPLKFLGCANFGRDATTFQVLKTVHVLIADYHRQFLTDQGEDSILTISDYWKKDLIYTVCRSLVDCCDEINSDEAFYQHPIFPAVRSGDIIIADIAHRHRKNPSTLPFEAFTVRHFLNYIYWKKIFELIPLTDNDAQYVLRRQKNNTEKMRIKSSDNSDLNNTELEQNENTDSNKRNRPDSGGNETPPENTESDADTLISAASSTEWLQINLPVETIGEYIASKLSVHPSQLTLFCGPSGDDPKHISPVLTPSEKECWSKFFDLNNRKAFKLTDYTIHYSILPYPVFSDDGNDLRFDKKGGDLRFMEFLICDSRLRNWRQTYLDFLLKLKNENNENNENVLNTEKKKRKKTTSDANVHPTASTDSEEYSWPDFPLEHQVAEDHMMFNKVFMKAHRNDSSSSVVRVLRTVLGLPVDLSNKLITLDNVFNNPQESSEDTAEEDDITYPDIADRSDESSVDLALRKRTKHLNAFLTEGVSAIAKDGKKVEVIPEYPISIVLIRDKMAAGVFEKDHEAEIYPYCTSESLTCLNMVYPVSVQYFAPDDLKWLMGGTDKVRSMPVTVFSFTLLGSCVKVCDPQSFSGPFISYVREDDDYDCVVRRFGMITGETEAECLLYRLAVVQNKIPFFVPRSTSTGGTSTHVHSAEGAEHSTDVTSSDKNHAPGGTNGNGNIAGEKEKEKEKEREKTRKEKTPSVWEKICEKYRYSDAVNYLLNRGVANVPKGENRFPQLGIQRSVTAATNAAGLRCNRRSSQSIKISG